jgi:Protein of unknown function (DUF2971)
VAELKIYAKPPNLYRYRPLGEKTQREVRAIIEGYIYCPLFSDMNDPMEGKYRLSTRFSSKVGGEKSPARVQEALNQMGIASLSEVSDHEPMWAHYADKFKGMCVQYNLNRLLKGMAPEITVTRMLYSEKEPVLLDDRSNAVDRARLSLSSKTVRWASEREWRVFRDVSGEAYYNDLTAVTKIFLGARVRYEDELEVRKIGKNLRIPVVKMEIDAYALSFKPLHVVLDRPNK